MTKSIFNVTNWQEEFVIEESVAHARATYKIDGHLKGTIEADYSILYLEYNKEDIHLSTSRFDGFSVFNGECDGKVGSLIFSDRGSFVDNQYDAALVIVKGTGDFLNAQGSGAYYPTEEGMVLELEVK